MRGDIFLRDRHEVVREAVTHALTLNNEIAPYATVPETTAVIFWDKGLVKFSLGLRATHEVVSPVPLLWRRLNGCIGHRPVYGAVGIGCVRLRGGTRYVLTHRGLTHCFFNFRTSESLSFQELYALCQRRSLRLWYKVIGLSSPAGAWKYSPLDP